MLSAGEALTVLFYLAVLALGGCCALACIGYQVMQGQTAAAESHALAVHEATKKQAGRPWWHEPPATTRPPQGQGAPEWQPQPVERGQGIIPLAGQEANLQGFWISTNRRNHRAYLANGTMSVHDDAWTMFWGTRFPTDIHAPSAARPAPPPGGGLPGLRVDDPPYSFTPRLQSWPLWSAGPNQHPQQQWQQQQPLQQWPQYQQQQHPQQDPPQQPSSQLQPQQQQQQQERDDQLRACPELPNPAPPAYQQQVPPAAAFCHAGQPATAQCAPAPPLAATPTPAGAPAPAGASGAEADGKQRMRTLEGEINDLETREEDLRAAGEKGAALQAVLAQLGAKNAEMEQLEAVWGPLDE